MLQLQIITHTCTHKLVIHSREITGIFKKIKIKNLSDKNPIKILKPLIICYKVMHFLPLMSFSLTGQQSNFPSVDILLSVRASAGVPSH